MVGRVVAKDGNENWGLATRHFTVCAESEEVSLDPNGLSKQLLSSTIPGDALDGGSLAHPVREVAQGAPSSITR